MVNVGVTSGAVTTHGASLENLLQQTLSPSSPVTVAADTAADVDNVVGAVNQLLSFDTPVTVTVNLAAGASFSDVAAAPPAGVTLVLDSTNGTTTIIGQSPALTVSSGSVVVTGITLTTATDAPTILVTGGSLELRQDDVENNGGAQPDISLTGGTVDLGTTTDPGNNTFDIYRIDSWFQNTTNNPIVAIGDTFEIDGNSAFMVTTTADSGTGSLRQAILDADAYDGPSTIAFDITAASDAAGSGTGYNPVTGLATINALSPLPPITGQALIDGYSQPGATPNSNGPTQADNAVLKIDLDGASAGSNAVGLQLLATGAGVQGLAINNYSGPGIYIAGSGGTVSGCFLGTDITGMIAEGNGGADIYVDAVAATIGGTVPGDRNVIAACANGTFTDGYAIAASGVGVFIGGDSSATSVQGNLIGLAANGETPLPNNVGIQVRTYYSAPVSIGGTTPQTRNVVSGNSSAGIEVDYDPGLLPIEGNFVGTDVSGMNAVGNGTGILLDYAASGVLIGGTAPGAGNVISANHWGIQLTSGNQVEGNDIGTDATGAPTLGNASGVVMFEYANNNTIGGTATGAGNLIAGNTQGAVYIGLRFVAKPSADNSITDNGNFPFYFGTVLLFYYASDNTVADNAIYDNASGIEVGDPGTFGNTTSQNSIYANRGSQYLSGTRPGQQQRNDSQRTQLTVRPPPPPQP